MATTKRATTKKAKVSESSVVVLATHVGQPLILRANPTDEAVRGFVEEHTRRYVAGEPGGPSGIAPFRIFNAFRFDSEEAWLEDANGTEIEIGDLLP